MVRDPAGPRARIRVGSATAALRRVPARGARRSLAYPKVAGDMGHLHSQMEWSRPRGGGAPDAGHRTPGARAMASGNGHTGGRIREIPKGRPSDGRFPLCPLTEPGIPQPPRQRRRVGGPSGSEGGKVPERPGRSDGWGFDVAPVSRPSKHRAPARPRGGAATGSGRSWTGCPPTSSVKLATGLPSRHEGIHRASGLRGHNRIGAARARSSVGQSTRLIIGGSQVRVLPGP
jgi:hypothetical protein